MMAELDYYNNDLLMVEFFAIFISSNIWNKARIESSAPLWNTQVILVTFSYLGIILVKFPTVEN